MKIENPRVCVATQKHQLNETTIYNSLVKFNLDKVNYFADNKESLATVYNKQITKSLKENVDCVILVHDDVILEENPIPKLEKLFNDFDLVGVAGTSKIELKSPALWHLMGGGFGSGNLHGCVQHTYRYDNFDIRKYETLFGKSPHKVVMIDGVFMALNRYAMENMRFDEDCPAKYHFYDILNSLDFHLSGGRVGVGDILITHESPGLREFTDEWKAGEDYFLNKFLNND